MMIAHVGTGLRALHALSVHIVYISGAALETRKI